MTFHQLVYLRNDELFCPRNGGARSLGDLIEHRSRILLPDPYFGRDTRQNRMRTFTREGCVDTYLYTHHIEVVWLGVVEQDESYGSSPQQISHEMFRWYFMGLYGLNRVPLYGWVEL